MNHPSRPSSIDLIVGRVLVEGSALSSNLNRFLGHARHAEARDQFASLFIKLRHASRSDMPRILAHLADLKYYTSKVHVEYETERRNAIVRPMDPNISAVLENTSQLLRLVEEAIYELEKIRGNQTAVLPIPQQSLAPIKVRIAEGRLTLDQETPPHQKSGSPELRSVRKHLRDEISRICENIRATNVDRRFVKLVEVFENLLEHEADSKIIALGMHVRLAEQALTQAAEDLPEICAIEIRGFLANINNYVNQFTDWAQFLEIARFEEIDSVSINEVGAVADKLKAKLEQATDVVDPKVPRSISFVREFLRAPKSFSKTSIYAVVRSLENLFIGVISFVIDKAAELASKSTAKIVNKLSEHAPYALLILLLSMYPDFLPLVLKIKSLAWIEEYVAFLRDVFTKLKS